MVTTSFWSINQPTYNAALLKRTFLVIITKNHRKLPLEVAGVQKFLLVSCGSQLMVSDRETKYSDLHTSVLGINKYGLTASATEIRRSSHVQISMLPVQSSSRSIEKI